MGLTYLQIAIGNPATPDRTEPVEFLIDSGAVHSVVPREVLRRLGIKPFKKTSFMLANGESIARDVGGAHFTYKGNEGVAPVVFGEKGDSALLGATTLEAMELALNPLTRDLYPLQMTLMSNASPWVPGRGGTISGRRRPGPE